MVLKIVTKEGISKAEAYVRLGVDRNTVVYRAAVAELAATNPDLYRTLRPSFKRKDSVKKFAETCRSFCEQELTASAILQFRKMETCAIFTRAKKLTRFIATFFLNYSP